MVDLRGPHHPTISYRPIGPSDLEVLEKIHCELFPIRLDDFIFMLFDGLLTLRLKTMWYTYFSKKPIVIFLGTSLSSSTMLLMAAISCLGELLTVAGPMVKVMNLLDLSPLDLFRQKNVR